MSRSLVQPVIAVCAGLFVLPVLAAAPFRVPPQNKLPTLQDAVTAQSKCALQHWPGTHQVATAGPDVVCFDSEITSDSSKKFLSLPIKDGSILVLHSAGGDASAALDMADVILAKHLTVVVDTLCASACASYLFIAAAAKIVLSGGIVGFHGLPGPGSDLKYSGPPEYRAIGFAAFQAYLKKLLDRQAAFFAHVGVSSSLASHSPLTRYASQFRFKTSLWEYGPTTLREKFGVRNIVYFQTPDQLGWLTRLRVSWLVSDCRSDSPDVYFCATRGND